VALLLLATTAGFSFAAFRQYLVYDQQRQVLDRDEQVARVLTGFFTGAIDEPTATYLLGGLEGALAARAYVVNDSGDVILSSGRLNVPPAAVPPAVLQQVLWRVTPWSGTLAAPGGTDVVAGVPILLGRAVVGGVFLEEPLAPATSRAAGLLGRLLLGGALGALLAAGAAQWLARRLSRPLVALREAATAVAAGRLDVRVAPEGPEEVAELGVRFNQMAENLARLVEDLRRESALRDELLAHVAHDLKTPLTAVRGYLEALLDHVLTGPEAERAVAVAHQETLRLQRLVLRLLQAARLEATAGLPESVTRFAVAPWLQGLMAALEPEAASRGVALALEGVAVAEATGYPDALAEVVQNLVDNAVKVSPAGARVRVRVLGEDGGMRVEVDDEGPGVPAELAERVFEPFVTGDRARAGGSTGLGLSIAARLVRRMGGRIQLEPRPGGGTRAWFWVPLAAPGREAEAQPPHAAGRVVAEDR
jgi:two-component system OmpR family sensor kinase